MAEPVTQQPSSGGLRHILVATVIAGAIGYLIQFLVPIVAPDSYLTFATTWSAIYLVVTCLSGLQQELTRASSADNRGSGFRPWISFTVIASLTATGFVAVIFGLSGPHLFPSDAGQLAGAIATAAFGYSLIAAVSGAAYGLKDWNAVAGLTITDSIVRSLTIASALLLGGSAILLGWAIAVPFLLAAVGIWIWVGRRIRSRLSIDVSLRRLMRNATATVLASLSTGALISGLPLMLNAFASDVGPELLASTILALTLTRAPLVVPLLALQGYLVVSFRDNPNDVAARVLRWAALVMGAVIVLAGIAALVGPSLMQWLYAGFLTLPPVDLALIVVSAGLTGVMCITGPAVLAANRHSWYTAGWASSAIVSIIVLLLPLDPQFRVMLALLSGPLIGALVHVFAVRAQRDAALGNSRRIS